MLNLQFLLNDKTNAIELDIKIKEFFMKGNDIYSTIDVLNKKRNSNHLRWAVVPYLLASSNI